MPTALARLWLKKKKALDIYSCFKNKTNIRSIPRQNRKCNCPIEFQNTNAVKV